MPDLAHPVDVAPGRPRLFRSSRGLLAAGLGLSVLLVVAGQVRTEHTYGMALWFRGNPLDTGSLYEHGWPWVWMTHRSPARNIDFFPWILADAWDLRWPGELRWGALVADLAVTLGGTALVVSLWQRRLRRRHRVWQLTLRESLAAVTLLSIVLGWWYGSMRQLATERQIARDLAPQSWLCTTSYCGPGWLSLLVGHGPLRMFDGVTSIDAGQGSDLPEIDPQLRQLMHLRELVIPAIDGPSADAALAWFAAHGRIELVSLSMSPLSEQGLKSLGEMPHLRALHLAPSGVDDRTAALLAPLATLEYCDLVAPELTTAGLERFAGWGRLRYLSLGSAHLDDDSLRLLARHRQLRELDLSQTHITQEGVARLQPLSRLRSIDLSRTDIGDSAIEPLCQLRRLEWIDLRATQVTLAGARQLTALPRLRGVAVEYANFGDEGFAELKRLLPRVSVLTNRPRGKRPNSNPPAASN